MTEWAAVLLALALPTLLGTAISTLVSGWPRHAGAWMLAVGEGFLLGALLLGNALWLAGDIATIGLLGRWGPFVLIGSLALGGLAWRLRRHAPEYRALALPVTTSRQRMVVTAVIVGLLLLGSLIAVQAVLLPTLTWDAWNAWLAKAKAWHHAGAFLPVVDVVQWLARSAEPVLSTVAAPYPEALPRYATWLASAAGRWQDGYVHSAWPALWFALGAMLAGALRVRGVGWMVAALAAAALLTLPLVTAHASLAGYADLWLAAAILAAGQHAARFAASGSPRAAVHALLFAVLLPTIKLEGAVWSLLIVVALALWLVPRRWRLHAGLGAAGVATAAVLLLPRIYLPVPGLGAVIVEGASITVPVVGQLDLFLRDVGRTVAQSLFLLPNWSLLWYLLLPLVAWRWRQLRHPDVAMLGLLLALGMLFLFVLFFFTDASRWAENLTSLNRLLMHLVPLLLFWMALLVCPPRDRLSPRGRWS
jgi:hypothetical protein